jgi:hypothetical protein
MGTLFTPAVLASAAYWQTANMPDRALVFVRVLARELGGVVRASYTFVRADACRLSGPTTAEGNQDGALSTVRTWTLVRPIGAPPLVGTERVMVVHRAGSMTLVRVVGERGARSLATIRKADVSDGGVTPFTVATTRARGPVRLAWSSTIDISIGSD